MGSDNKSIPQNEEITVNYGKLITITLIPLLIGLALATAIFSIGYTEKYRDRIDNVAADDFHWVFLALVVFGRMVALVNFVPAGYKKGMKGNIRSNPFFYKVSDSGKDGSIIVYEDEGNLGKYNRANRSVHHMVENFGGFLAGLVTAGSIFPFPVFVLTCMFCMGRIIHQKGYTVGYGKHALGFLLSTLATAVLEGLLLLVYLTASTWIRI